MTRLPRLAAAALLAAAAGCSAARPGPRPPQPPQPPGAPEAAAAADDADAPRTPWTPEDDVTLESYLAAVQGWEAPPDPEGLAQSCRKDPRVTAGWKPEQDGIPPAAVEPPARPPVTRLISGAMQDVLCRRDISRCAALDPLASRESADLMANDPNDPPPGHRPLHDARWCSRLATELFYLQSIARGRPDPDDCGILLDLEFPKPLTAEEKGRLCPLMEKDIHTPGGDALCREISSRTYGGRKTPYADCSGSGLWFARGEEYCTEQFGANENLYICQLKARVFKAARSGELADCRQDRYCEALFDAPTACAGAARRDKGLSTQALCEAWSFHRVQDWIFDVDAHARPVQDRLLAFRERLARDPDAARRWSGRVDKAIAAGGARMETMERLRERMNRGELPGQKTPGGAVAEP